MDQVIDSFAKNGYVNCNNLIIVKVKLAVMLIKHRTKICILDRKCSSTHSYCRDTTEEKGFLHVLVTLFTRKVPPALTGTRFPGLQNRCGPSGHERVVCRWWK